MRRSVNAVSIATSEYFRCPPRVPPPSGSQAAIASGDNHTVTSPRSTRLKRPRFSWTRIKGESNVQGGGGNGSVEGRGTGRGIDADGGSPEGEKLHLGVNRSGIVVAQALTDATVDDEQTGITLMEAVDGGVASFTADAAYDTIAFYDTATKRGAKVVVPPAKTASLSRRGPRSTARDRTIRRITKVGRRRWKKVSGYHRQARVENMIFRYKSILGGGLRARTPGGQDVESVLACNMLNRMTELGRPESFAIGR